MLKEKQAEVNSSSTAMPTALGIWWPPHREGASIPPQPAFTEAS